MDTTRKDDGYVMALAPSKIQLQHVSNAMNVSLLKNYVNVGMFDHVHGTQDDMLPRIKDGRTFWYRKTYSLPKMSLLMVTRLLGQVTQTHRINSYECYLEFQSY